MRFSPESLLKIQYLVDDCPVHPFSKTNEVIKEQFGVNNISDMFDSFCTSPMASGAIAQVYQAVYKGEKVAVKVLHPDIFGIIERDLLILDRLKKNILYYYPDSQYLGLDEALKQFEETMKSQTNLRIEGENLKIFSKNFAHTENVVFPEYITASNDVLVESFCEGMSMKDYLKRNHPLEERQFMAALGLRAFLKMIILDNFVHADMHSGNILVTFDKLEKNKNSLPSIVVLDVGLTTYANEDDLTLIKDLFKSVGSHNPESGAEVLVRHSAKKGLNQADVDGFVKEMSSFFSIMYHADPKYYNATKGLGEMLDIQRKYKVQHPGNLTTLILGMIVLEGIGKQLYTDETRIFDDALAMLIKKKTQENFLVKNINLLRRKIFEFRNDNSNPQLAVSSVNDTFLPSNNGGDNMNNRS